MHEADRAQEAEKLGFELLLESGIGHNAEAARVHLSRVIHEDVDAAELLARALHQPRDVVGLHHVRDHGMNFAAGRFHQLLAGALQRLRIAPADRHPYALFQKLPRRLPADAAACAGHDRRAALDAQIHDVFLAVVAIEMEPA